ncbi:hypothetical protein ACQ86D_04160 [Streptomyces galilaeus]
MAAVPTMPAAKALGTPSDTAPSRSRAAPAVFCETGQSAGGDTAR